MKPVVDRLREEFEGRVEFRIVNFDQDANANEEADRFGVRFVPTFIFLDSDGEQVDMRVGSLAEEELRELLESVE